VRADQDGGAAAPGPVAPASDNARDQAGVIGTDQSADGRDFASTGDERKRRATLAARLALKGYAMQAHLHADGGVSYTVSRWGLVRHFDGAGALEQAEQFAIDVGAGPK
jgi:hypothetical protein